MNRSIMTGLIAIFAPLILSNCKLKDGPKRSALKMDATRSPSHSPHTLKGHKKGVTSIAVAHDQSTFVTGSEDTTAKIWRIHPSGWTNTFTLGAEKNVRKHHSQIHFGVVRAVDISRDSRLIVTASEDKTAKIWEFAYNKWSCQQTLGKYRNTDSATGHTDHVTAVAISKNKQLIVTGSEDTTAKIWTSQRGQWTPHTLGMFEKNNPNTRHSAGITSVAINEAGNTIVTGSKDGTAIVWSAIGDNWIMSQRLGVMHNPNINSGHTASITTVKFYDQDTIVTGSSDRTAIVWTSNGLTWNKKYTLGKILNEDPNIGHTDALVALIVNKITKNIATVSKDQSVIIWKFTPEGWSIHKTLETNKGPTGHKDYVSSLAFLKENDNTLSTGSWDKTIKTWLLGQ